MPKSPKPQWRSIHRALADPLRLRLVEALWEGRRSAKELATQVETPPDRLYYHLSQLVDAGLIEIAEYRPLPGGKVERVYGPVDAEPPGDTEDPDEIGRFLAAVLDATQIELAAAFTAKRHGRRRETALTRTTVRLDDRQLDRLRETLEQIVHESDASEDHADGGVVARAEFPRTRVVFTLVDLDDRNGELSTGGGDGAGR